MEKQQENEAEQKSVKERLYDKVPLNYRQVDVITKILIGIFAALMIYAIVTR